MGRVKSLNYNKTGKEHIVPQNTNSRGYCQVSLYKNGKNKCYRVNRLVALAFIPNPDNKPQVNHLNEIRSDNRITNLEWTTIAENSNYGNRNDKMAESHYKSVRCIETGEEYKSITYAAECIGVVEGSIRNAIKKGGTCKGHHWELKKETAIADSSL